MWTCITQGYKGLVGGGARVDRGVITGVDRGVITRVRMPPLLVVVRGVVPGRGTQSRSLRSCVDRDQIPEDT